MLDSSTTGPISGSSSGVPLDVMAFVVLIVAFVASTVLFFLFQKTGRSVGWKVWKKR
jgi:hypothetical protein